MGLSINQTNQTKFDMFEKGRCQFGESKISVNLATPTPVNMANFCVNVVNVANRHIFSGGGAYVGNGGEGGP